MSVLFASTPKWTGVSPTAITGIRFQASTYGLPIPIVYGRSRITANVIWYGDFQALAESGPSMRGGKGGGGSISSPTQYVYRAAFAMGLCEGPIAGIGQVWASKQLTTLAAQGMTLFPGTRPTQAPWGYLTSNHPGQDLGYAGLAYIAVAGYDLGNSGNLPNLSYEVEGLNQYDPTNAYGYGAVYDALPSTILVDFLTNAEYGVGLSSAQLGNWSVYDTYCKANGLFLSPALVSQQAAVDVVKRWLDLTNSVAFWSEGVIKIVPYGDSQMGGHGATYTPNLAPLYAFTDDDYLDHSGDEPVQQTRQTPADAYNLIRVEYLDRANAYNPAPAEAKDQLSINTYGLRPQSVYQAHEITTIGMARLVAQFLLQRQLYVRNMFKFQVDQRYVLLDPMDYVTITDSQLALSALLVRVIEIEEDEQGVVTLTCEQVRPGISSAPVYAQQAPSGSAPNWLVSPGSTNAPFLWQPPPKLAESALEVWVGASGGPNWGGCEVWISPDGTTYARAAIVRGPCRQGVLLAALPTGADPDTLHALNVDLTQSVGMLLSGSQADADNDRTLCYVDGELIDYETATLTATNQYSLTYLRRGRYDTAVQSHPVGAIFVRLDEAIARMALSPSEAGQTLYVKLPAFNIYGLNVQALSSCTAYQITLAQAHPLPPNVTGLELIGQGNNTSFLGRDAKFDWRARSSSSGLGVGSLGQESDGLAPGATDPTFKNYRIDILDATGATKYRTDYVTSNSYTYSYEKNLEDQTRLASIAPGSGQAATPVRTFMIRVWQQDQYNQLSPIPAQLVVSNPVPAVPNNIALTPYPLGILVSWAPNTEPDVVGYKVWMSTTNGFAPNDATNLIGRVSHPGSVLAVNNLSPGTTYYVIVAAYDTFGETGLNLSPQFWAQPASVLAAQISGTIAALQTNIGLVQITAGIFTDNSPSAGSIAWAGVQVLLNGMSYAIADGNTNASWLYWRVGNGTFSTSSAGFPTLGRSDYLLGWNNGGTWTPLWNNWLKSGVITGTLIAANTILANNLAAGSVTTAAILAGAITSATIATGAVTTGAIAAGAITTGTIAAGAVTAATIASLAVGTSNIQASAIVQSLIATGAVGSAQIATAAVVNAALASASVATANIQNNAIGTAQIATAAITTALITTGAITTALIANAAVGTAQIATAAITTALITTGAITTALIANAAVGTAQIATAAITNALIASAAIQTANISDLNVTTLKIAGGGVSTSGSAASSSGSTGLIAPNTWTTVCSFTLTNGGAASNVSVRASSSLSITTSSGNLYLGIFQGATLLNQVKYSNAALAAGLLSQSACIASFTQTANQSDTLSLKVQHDILATTQNISWDHAWIDALSIMR